MHVQFSVANVVSLSLKVHFSERNSIVTLVSNILLQFSNWKPNMHYLGSNAELLWGSNKRHEHLPS